MSLRIKKKPCYKPDSEIDGLPVDLSELRELLAEPVDDTVVTEHSDTLRRLDIKAAVAAAATAAAELHDDVDGALVLSP